ncbi:hypothetical protein BDR04DRAFT_1115499 [Suillus decipiens]|nr:hypothetical protein BDR04DRAFT_1115499 [Suillus decipiens]
MSIQKFSHMTRKFLRIPLTIMMCGLIVSDGCPFIIFCYDYRRVHMGPSSLSMCRNAFERSRFGLESSLTGVFNTILKSYDARLSGSLFLNTVSTNKPLPDIRICASRKHRLRLSRIYLRRGRIDFNILRMERKYLVGALVYGNVHYFFCILANAVNTGIWQGVEVSEVFATNAAVIEISSDAGSVLNLKSAVSDSEGLHLLDLFPHRISVREGSATLYSAVSTMVSSLCKVDIRRSS